VLIARGIYGVVGGIVTLAFARFHGQPNEMSIPQVLSGAGLLHIGTGMMRRRR
jgi:hypothetical protein